MRHKVSGGKMKIVNIRIYDLTVFMKEDFLEVPNNLNVSKEKKDWQKSQKGFNCQSFADYLISRRGAKRVNLEVYSTEYKR